MPTTLNTDLVREAVSAELFVEAQKQAYFQRMMGGTKNNMIYVKGGSDDLKKHKGDKVTFGLRARLPDTVDAVTAGETLEGKEQSLTTYSDSVTLGQYRFGIRDDGEYTRHVEAFSIDNESKEALEIQGAEWIDKQIMNSLQTSPTKTMYGGDATSTISLVDADLIDTALISRVKYSAQEGFSAGGTRAQPPLTPIRIDGKDHFVMLVSNACAYDLKRNTVFQNAQRDAMGRGSDNPLFTGAIGEWDGVIIHAMENVPNGLKTDTGFADFDGLTNLRGSRNLFMGASALCWAWGTTPTIVDEEFDYGDQHGFAWKLIAGWTKTNFNSLDFGCVSVETAASNISA